MASLYHLPLDVLKIILYSIPEAYRVLRGVCRRWRSIIARPRTMVARLYWHAVHGTVGRVETSIMVFLCIKHRHLGIIGILCERKSAHLCYAAVEYRNMELLTAARHYGCPPGPDLCQLAASKGDFNMLRFLRDELRQPINEDVFVAAAIYGDITMLKWLHYAGCEWDSRVCHELTRMGRLSSLQWVHYRGCPWDERVCQLAAQYGYLHILQWAHYQGCPWDKQTFQAAALCGNLEILVWLRKQRCPWDEWVCINAAARGYLDVLQWAYYNGAPLDAHVREYAVMFSQRKILEWLDGMGFPGY